jgi:hypothetical protein
MALPITRERCVGLLRNGVSVKSMFGPYKPDGGKLNCKAFLDRTASELLPVKNASAEAYLAAGVVLLLAFFPKRNRLERPVIAHAKQGGYSMRQFQTLSLGPTDSPPV